MFELIDVDYSGSSVKLTKDDFINKTKLLLGKLNVLYSECWSKSPVDCDKTECKEGCGTIELCGRGYDCVMDVEGGCYAMTFDNELFLETYENIMFQDNNSDFHNLLHCDLIDEPEVDSKVIEVIKNIPQQPQVQYDTNRQLRELRVAANKLGLYDAADFIKPKNS